jgi:uncharacterized protein YjcR
MPAAAKKKRRGAPAGNRNARTHGLYSKAPPISPSQALTIEERRNIADTAIRWVWDYHTNCTDVADVAKLIAALKNAMDAANNCERTLAIVSGKYTPLEDILAELKTLDPSED